MTDLLSIPRQLLRVPDATGRFARIFTETMRWNRMVRDGEKVHGKPLPKAQLQPILVGWSEEMLRCLNIRLERIGHASETPLLFVGNHVSYVDIPLVMASAPGRFVAKRQIFGWPIIGPAADSAGTVWVERGSGTSRRDAASAIVPSIRDRGQSVILFPSGTTTVDEAKPWRFGAFKIAKDNDFLVQPFRIRYRPLRVVAFIQEDLFAPHLWRLLSARDVEASIEFGEPRKITKIEKDCDEVRRWTLDGLEGQ